MTVRPLYVIAKPVLGLFDAEGRLLREIEAPVQKLFHPFDSVPALLAHFQTEAERQLGETAAETAPDSVE